MADRDITSFRADQVHASAFLAAGARVTGDVTIGPESSVWFNAVLRGDCAEIRLGERTNVQDNAVLHADPGVPCILGNGVTVGHTAIVHGAEIGDNVLIGMHAVVMNRAKIGANSIVGVGAVVTEGTEVPPGSLVVGLPGKVKRAVNEAEIAGNRLAAQHYVEHARQYKAAAEANRPT